MKLSKYLCPRNRAKKVIEIRANEVRKKNFKISFEKSLQSKKITIFALRKRARVVDRVFKSQKIIVDKLGFRDKRKMINKLYFYE